MARIDPLVARPLLGVEASPPYQSFELHPGAFTVGQCARILALGEDLALEGGHLEGADGAEIVDTGIRRSNTAWLAPGDRTWWIYDKLATICRRANRRYRFDLTGFGEDLQFTVYDSVGAFYDWHQDGLDGSVGTRKLSIVIQLTDPSAYTGGEVQFFDVVNDYDGEDLDTFTELSRQQGTVIVFPSFEYHRVLPLRSGVRTSLVAWVSGPAFR